MWPPAASRNATRRLRGYALGMLAMVAAYWVTCELALQLHELDAVPSVIWVPSGIGLALVLLYGPRWWPGVALGTFVTVALRHHPLVATVTAATEVLEVLACYYVLHDILGFRPQLDRVRDVAAFVAVSVAASVTGASIAAATLTALGLAAPTGLLSLWSTWWWYNASGDLIVAPALLTWLVRSRVPRRMRSFEIVAVVVSGLMVSALVLASWLPGWLPASRTPYYLLPIMLWAGVRFGPRGAATASVVVSLAAIVADSVGVAPFPERPDLHAFVVLSSFTTLLVSALVEERVRATERRGAIQRGALDGIITTDKTGRVLELNPAAEQLFKLREADAIGRDLATLVIPPRLRDAYHRGLHRYASTGASSIVGSRYRATAWRECDGAEFPVEIAVARAPSDDQMLITGFIRDVSAELAAESARREAAADLERKVDERTAELRESLRQGDTLLREIHHRVKNNLQVISSLLNLQVSTARDEPTRRVLVESQNRISAMALVHQLLYRSKDVARIDFGEYIDDLVARLVAAYHVDRERIAIEVATASVSVDLDRAISCGLIVNELVTNALTHAFPGTRKGRIRISLEQQGDVFVLVVADDGVGLPAGTHFESPGTFGLKIVHALVQQIDGSLSVIPNEGTTVRIVFPVAPGGPTD